MPAENTSTDTSVPTGGAETRTAHPLDDWVNQLHHGDSEELLNDLPNASIDCVVTSPPYWGLRDYGVDGQLGFEPTLEEYTAAITNLFTDLKHVLRADGAVFLLIGDQYQSTAPGTQNTASNLNEKTSEAQGTQYRFDAGLPAKSSMLIPERIVTDLVDNGWVLRNKIVWEKSNPMPEPSAVDRFTQSWGPLYFLTKNSQYHFNEDMASELDRWEIPTASVETSHPAPFPVELCKRAIAAACPPDGVVLDPFVGSGTTCVAAKALGRDYIGFDLNSEYLAEARERLATTIQSRTDTDQVSSDGWRDSAQNRLDQYTTN